MVQGVAKSWKLETRNISSEIIIPVGPSQGWPGKESYLFVLVTPFCHIIAAPWTYFKPLRHLSSTALLHKGIFFVFKRMETHTYKIANCFHMPVSPFTSAFQCWLVQDRMGRSREVIPTCSLWMHIQEARLRLAKQQWVPSRGDVILKREVHFKHLEIDIHGWYVFMSTYLGHLL